MVPDNDTTALALVAGGGGPGADAALARFVQLTQPDVCRLAAHLVDPGAADDLAQETYERALRALPRFRGESSARTWLLSIARRTCADEVRRRARRRARDHRLEVLAVERAAPLPTADVELADLLAGLDPDRREAFVLTQVLGYGYAEAAAVCACPVGTIRSRVARARADLAAAWPDPAATDVAVT